MTQTLDDALNKFRLLPFREFAPWALGAAISGERVNTTLKNLSGTDVRGTEMYLRLAIALHFILGKRAEFVLSDAAVTRLVQIVLWGRANPAVYRTCAALTVQLLSLSTATATIGVENQMASEFIASGMAAASAGSPTRGGSSSPSSAGDDGLQQIILPLVRRAFYVRGRSSLSARIVEEMITRQVSDMAFGEQMRCFAVVNANRGSVEELIVTQLLNADVTGVKPMFGSAPAAIGLDGKKMQQLCILFSCENPTASQIHHCYIVSAFNSYIDTFTAAHPFAPIVNGSPNARNSVSTSSTARTGRGLWPGGRQQPLHRPLPFTGDMCRVLVQYLQLVFGQISAYTSSLRGARVPLFSAGKSVIGLRFVEAVICELLKLTRRLFQMFPTISQPLVGEATSFLYTALELSWADTARLPSSELPELAAPDLSLPAARMPREGVALFSSSVTLRCLEFLIEVAPLTEIQNFFGDIFVEPTWSRLVEDDGGSFPLQFCLILLRNTNKLHPLLWRLSPRIMWLLSQRPHTLFPVVRRLIPHLYCEATALDIFCRIVYLPLLTFSAQFEPAEDSSDPFLDMLWRAMLDFKVDERRRTTAFADFCMRHQQSFDDWDSLHHEFACFTPAMMTSFRLIRPLLSDYLKCSPLPPQILPAIGMAYFFMLAPEDCKHIVGDYLQEMGRWIVQSCPELLLASSHTFIDLLKQNFLPPEVRCWSVQRWAAILCASALTAISHLDATSKEAVKVFDIVHELVWELTATASAEISIDLATSAAAAGGSNAFIDRLSARHFAPSGANNNGGARGGLSTNRTARATAAGASSSHSGGARGLVGGYEPGVGGSGQSASFSFLSGSTPSGATRTNPLSGAGRGLYATAQRQPTAARGAAAGFALAADFSAEASEAAPLSMGGSGGSGRSRGAVPDWRPGQRAWVAPANTQAVKGVAFSEHLHALIISLALLTRICPTAKERGIICLAHVVKTLSRSQHRGSSLVTTAILCMKYLRFPLMTGVGSMPLRALLGLHLQP